MIQNINLTNKSNLQTFVGQKNTQQFSFSGGSSNSITQNTVKAPVPTLIAYMMNGNTSEKIDVKFSVPITELTAKYSDIAKQQIEDLNSRAGKAGQVLHWIKILPETQIQRLDEIYSIAETMKNNGNQKLGIIGIGGSKHTIENMLSLNNKSENVEFLSAVDPESMEKFVKKLGDLSKAIIMVASKSGTTLEPSTGYEYVEKAFLKYFKQEFLNRGVSEPEADRKAKAETAKHFVCITDEDESKSKLKKIAKEKGYTCGVIHNDCGGRFGAFDDHALIALAFCEMPKEDMKKMLEASLKAQKKFLSTDLNINLAMKRAIFNTDCVLNGKTNQHDYYFSDVFDGTRFWNTQLKKESHKALYKVSGDLIGPEFLHNSAESDLDSGNTTSFYTFNRIKTPDTPDFKAYNALISAGYKAYSKNSPVSEIALKNLSPETIGEFVELKHFETVYTGMLLRNLKNAEKQDILPEVTQPNVSLYKKELRI